MATKRTSLLWPLAWVLFYAGVLPYAMPQFLDWLSRPSNWWLGWGILGLSGLVIGVTISVFQAGRALVRYLLHPTSHIPPSTFNDSTSTKS